MKTFEQRLLEHLNITEEQFIHLTRPLDINDIPHFSCIDNINECKELIKKHVDDRSKILIYGDYDCDGIMSTSIIKIMLKKVGLNADSYIPSRYLDGYGITIEKVLLAKEKDYKLIITVDNGIVAFDAISKARELGIDVIVIDHHQKEEQTPKANVIIHPDFSKLGNVTTSGGCMSFFVSYCFLEEIDPYLLSLGGISIISDMMPLLDYNRDIVRVTIDLINKYKFPQLMKLMDNMDTIDETSISFNLVPKVNAVGRIEQEKEVNYTVKLFVSEDQIEIAKLCSYLEHINEKRKKYSNEIFESMKIDSSNDIIIVKLDILEGMAGLLCNKLLSTYGKPVVVFSSIPDEDGIITGSIRVNEFIDTFDILDKIDKYLTHSGGHKKAAGLGIKLSDFEEVKNLVNSIIINKEQMVDNDDYMEISLSDISRVNFNIQQKLKPFGTSFSQPLYKVLNVDFFSWFKEGIDNRVIKSLGIKERITAFRLNKSDYIKDEKYTIVGNLMENKFRGDSFIELLLRKIY